MIKTIGHSSHSIERFIELLRRGGVQLLVDVRSKPYSRRFPQFGRERLAHSLSEAGISYLWEGDALGGLTDGGTARSYNDIAARPAFKTALDSVVEKSRTLTLCLMCAEKEPLDCHRTVLVARRLAERGLAIEHLLADGAVSPHAGIEDALLAKAAGSDLFEDRTQLLARAYDARERARKGKRV